MGKEYITEAMWSKIFKFLSAQPGIYVKNEEKCKRFIFAVLWVLRSGAQWREVPEKYGEWNSVFKRFDAWSTKSIWEALFCFCSQDADLEYVSIDSTVVRAHASAAGYGKQKDQALGRSRGGFSTKVHAKVDALGNPLRIIVTPGNTSDVTQAASLLQGTTQSYVIADKGYDATHVRQFIEDRGGTPVIPSRSNAKNPANYDKHIYKERHVIECFFSKIKHFRRIASRFDKKLANFSSFLAFVSVLVWLR